MTVTSMSVGIGDFSDEKMERFYKNRTEKKPHRSGRGRADETRERVSQRM
jgi:hypothetical protein